MTLSWYNLQAFAFDKPVQYKNLLVYPVTMENYFEFQILSQSLLLEKNSTVEGISKTYLEYLCMLNNQGDEEQNLMKFDALLRMCLKIKDLMIIYTPKNFTIYKTEEDYKQHKDGDIYIFKDFDELRTLICEQNDVEIPDELINPDVRASMEKDKIFKIKQSGTIPPSLEDLVICIMASTSLKPNDIAELSIRKFGQLVQRIDAKLHYQIYLTSAMSGMVEFKDKSVLKHWMSGENKDKWKDAVEFETMKSKIAFDDKKK